MFVALLKTRAYRGAKRNAAHEPTFYVTALKKARKLIRLRHTGITLVSDALHLRRAKKQALRSNPKRGIGFEEAQELFSKPYWVDLRSDVPEQYVAVGWVGSKLYSVIFEVREDGDGEVLHLVTLWRSTKEEVRLYEENS